MIFFRLLPLVLAGLFVAFTAPSPAQGMLRVAVLSNAKPLSWRDDGGELKGLNVELALMLCTVAKLTCRLEDLPLAEALSRLAAGELDFVVGALAETEQRRRQMLFTRPYLRGPSFWIGQSSTENTAKLASGARIGVSQARGTALVESLNAALDTLEKEGRLDALLTKHLPFRIN